MREVASRSVCESKQKETKKRKNEGGETLRRVFDCLCFDFTPTFSSCSPLPLHACKMHTADGYRPNKQNAHTHIPVAIFLLVVFVLL